MTVKRLILTVAYNLMSFSCNIIADTYCKSMDFTLIEAERICYVSFIIWRFFIIIVFTSYLWHFKTVNTTFWSCFYDTCMVGTY